MSDEKVDLRVGDIRKYKGGTGLPFVVIETMNPIVGDGRVGEQECLVLTSQGDIERIYKSTEIGVARLAPDLRNYLESVGEEARVLEKEALNIIESQKRYVIARDRLNKRIQQGARKRLHDKGLVSTTEFVKLLEVYLKPNMKNGTKLQVTWVKDTPDRILLSILQTALMYECYYYEDDVEVDYIETYDGDSYMTSKSTKQYRKDTKEGYNRVLGLKKLDYNGITSEVTKGLDVEFARVEYKYRVLVEIDKRKHPLTGKLALQLVERLQGGK